MLVLTASNLARLAWIFLNLLVVSNSIESDIEGMDTYELNNEILSELPL